MAIKRGLALTTFVASLLACATTVHAADSFPNYPEPDLPSMGACMNAEPKPLPEQWQATALMSPYFYVRSPNDPKTSFRAQLQVGRFVYDGQHGLMRGTRYGVQDGGILDLLISAKATYILKGSYENPQCVATLNLPYQLPSRIWQDQKKPYKAVCVGSHRTAPDIEHGPIVDWWKQLSPVKAAGARGQAADWYWVDNNGYPTRTMFWSKHDGLPAILGEYAFTNFYQFGPGNDIDLTKILATCQAATLPVWNEKQALQPQPGKTNPAGTLIPGLSYQACSRPDVKPPTWPVNIYMTSFSTAAKYSTPKPLPTSVYYKPHANAKTNEPWLRTRLNKEGTVAPDWGDAIGQSCKNQPQWSDALLIHSSSYGLDICAKPPYQQLGCASGFRTSLPGAPHDNWGVVGQCQCMGVIDNNPVLSPGRSTEVIACPARLVSKNPLKQVGNTLFWMWYTVPDKPDEPMQPLVFMQTLPDITIGTGLSLADYTHWERKENIPDDTFTQPNACPPPAHGDAAPGACVNCHNKATN